ncbi:ATP-grasp domain-containing protein [Streptomyces sp. CYG20]|uniref:ATP-grasp domain-containing protein n=1 Tax=Streptomyces sp. CYG20 TaxID=2838873 RepID=UPI001BFF62A4|nr:ATP-grasp domain-containing protein [Streptomyces sp. CYG20]MBT3113209.1 ATP-grasp domain-containing protein [Streptomyces sp. CYG20]
MAVETVGSVHDVDEVLAAAWRIAGRHPLDGVLAPYEVGLPAAGYVRTVLGLPGPDFTTATLFTNKHAMKQRLAAAGLPLMPFAGAHSDAQVRARAAEFGWPVVVKPAYGGGSKDVAVVADAAELDAWLAGGGSPRPRNPTAVVERRADILVEYNCDGVVHDGAVRSVVTSRYLEPVLGRIGQGDPYGSYQLPSDHPEHRAVAELHAAAVAALGLRSGVTHLEVFGTPDGLRVSEVACRPGGGAIPARDPSAQRRRPGGRLRPYVPGPAALPRRHPGTGPYRRPLRGALRARPAPRHHHRAEHGGRTGRAARRPGRRAPPSGR